MVTEPQIVCYPTRPFASATVEGLCLVCDGARFIPADDLTEDRSFRPCPSCATLHESASRINDATIPARFAAADFYTLDFNGNSAGERYTRQLSEAVDVCSTFARGGGARGGKTWVLLCGPTGTAKTHLLCAVARNAALNGVPVAYISMNDVFTGHKEAGQAGEGAFLRALFHRVSTVPMLLLDEVGCGRTDTEMALTSRIIQRRYDVALPMASATNFMPRGDGERALSSRLYEVAHSRLVGCSDIVPLVGTDFRQGPDHG